MTVVQPPPSGSTERIVNRIKSLVYRWMSIWDGNTGDAAPLLELLSPEGFQIHVSDLPAPLRDIAGVQAWFAQFPKRVAVVNHHIGQIEVSPLPSGHHRVVIHVSAPGVAVTGQAFVANSVHEWDVVDFGGLFPRIVEASVHLLDA